MKEYISKNVEQTQEIAQKFAKEIQGGEIIALNGKLGAGKTVFVKALAQAMGIEQNITSPTFVLMKVYDLDYGQINKFVHVDCYRLDGKEDLFDIGLGDYLNYDNIVVVIEWADKLLNFPKDTIVVDLQYIDDETRKISIENLNESK